tara:strand:+ start:465 stop:1973 length:1509 start_codon:yes stop_codon:yes gene_type:complete
LIATTAKFQQIDLKLEAGIPHAIVTCRTGLLGVVMFRVVFSVAMLRLPIRLSAKWICAVCFVLVGMIGSAGPLVSVAQADTDDLYCCYQVRGVASDDILNVRLSTDHRSRILYVLRPDQTNISIARCRTTDGVALDPDWPNYRPADHPNNVWCEVYVEQYAGTGWVNAAFLEPQPMSGKGGISAVTAEPVLAPQSNANSTPPSTVQQPTIRTPSTVTPPPASTRQAGSTGESTVPAEAVAEAPDRATSSNYGPDAPIRPNNSPRNYVGELIGENGEVVRSSSDRNSSNPARPQADSYAPFGDNTLLNGLAFGFMSLGFGIMVVVPIIAIFTRIPPAKNRKATAVAGLYIGVMGFFSVSLVVGVASYFSPEEVAARDVQFARDGIPLLVAGVCRQEAMRVITGSGYANAFRAGADLGRETERSLTNIILLEREYSERVSEVRQGIVDEIGESNQHEVVSAIQTAQIQGRRIGNAHLIQVLSMSYIQFDQVFYDAMESGCPPMP